MHGRSAAGVNPLGTERLAMQPVNPPFAARAQTSMVFEHFQYIRKPVPVKHRRKTHHEKSSESLLTLTALDGSIGGVSHIRA